jgi:DNA (cytosine-5)-methyltransferase 1
VNELALFAGVGGGLLASRNMLGWRAVCYVERNTYAVKVLKARIRDGLLDDAPIWDDVNTFDGRPWTGRVDIISAGFPCQPFSCAGKRLGENDPRNGWPATIRIVREIRPRVVWLENVSNLTSNRYFGRILGDLAESGYDVAWDCISAGAVGAPHKRERIWLLAYAESQPLDVQQLARQTLLFPFGDGAAQPLPHPDQSQAGLYAEYQDER